MIVLLRIGIGWHFLYEGVHKFDPAAGFSSEGFLGIAKGPTAELYYWMLPDLDGIMRLEMGKVESGRVNANNAPIRTPASIADESAWDEYFKVYAEGTPVLISTFIVYENAWKEYFKDYLVKHSSLVSATDAEDIVNMTLPRLVRWLMQKQLLSEEDAVSTARLNVAQISEWERVGKDDVPVLKNAKTIVAAKRIFDRYLGSLRADATDEEGNVQAFKESRERFLKIRNTVRNSATFEQERRWQAMLKYRAEAAYWIRKFNAMGNALQSDLGRLVDPQLAGQRGEIVTAPERELFPPHPLLEQYGIQYTIPPNPYIKSRMQAMDYAVMFGLSAIGLCLILGFCTRLACLGGAAFLVNVILTTYPVPGVYPEIPSMVGNFMFVSKDVVELLALLMLALVPAGRWGGLDYFLWNYGGKQIVGLFCPCACSTEKRTA